MSEPTSFPEHGEKAETVVPVKVPQPEDHAPPSLAQPASGPAAEMSGALPQDAAKPAEAPATSGVNGDAPSAEPAVPEKPIETEPEAMPSEDAPKTTEEQAPVTGGDTAMDDAAPPQPTEDSATAPAETNGTPASKSKRKSTGTVPEHRSKTLKKKQSKPKITNLDCKPGDLFLARLRSYPPWPSIICDEAMLPDVLLNSRPVTALQADGTYKEPYADGGKKVMDRTFAVMFLHTNEFGWIPNTDLTPLDPEQCKDVSEKGKAKSLIDAYKVAAEGHDLEHFKEVLMEHEAFLQQEEEAKEARAAEKAAKAAEKKKNKRKSEVKPADTDVDMDDADDAPPKKAGSKKRKKDAESDDDGPDKLAKTPKTTKLKLTTGKTPTTDKKAEKKTPKSKSEKKKKAAESEEEEEPAKEEAPPLDPVQDRKDREKEVLFLRHKLQKGFLSREQEPAETEMPQMATYIKKLEAYGDKIEVGIIRSTKINKVLKGIVKLTSIPKDEEYHFKERSVKLLGAWNQLLGAEPADDKPTKDDSGKEDKATTPTTTNGVHQDAEAKAEEKIEQKVEEPKANTMSAEHAVDQISADVPADPAEKAAAVEEVRKDEPVPAESAPEAPKTEAPAAPSVEEKAPESAPAAAEAVEAVKATE